MRTCNNCGAEVADNAKFCRSCGAKLMDPEDVTVILDGDPNSPGIPPAEADNGYQDDLEDYQGIGSDGYQGGGSDGYQDGGFGGYQGGGSDGYQDGGFGGYQGGSGGYQGGGSGRYPGGGSGGYPGGGSGGYPGGGSGGYQGGGSGGYPGGGSGGYPGGGRPVKPVQNWDHTNEFDTKDVSENKAVAMLVYLLGFLGIIIALLAGTTSPYAAFHVRQGLKFVVLDTLIAIVAFLFFLIMIPFTTGSLLSGLSGYGYGGGVDLGGFAAIGGFGAIVYLLLGAFSLVLAVVKIICFFSICKGEAKEPPIVRAFGFLR